MAQAMNQEAKGENLNTYKFDTDPKTNTRGVRGAYRGDLYATIPRR